MRERHNKIPQYKFVYTEREREQNLVRAENRVDCFQHEFLGDVRDCFCVQPISAFNLGYVTKYVCVTALIQTTGRLT